MRMGYIQGVDRNQARIVTLDSMVAAESHARIIDAFVEEYLRRLDAIDSLEEPGEDDLLTREVVEAKLAEAEGRLARYRGYRELMERRTP